MKKYIVITINGVSLDEDGNDVENCQVLDLEVEASSEEEAIQKVAADEWCSKHFPTVEDYRAYELK